MRHATKAARPVSPTRKSASITALVIGVLLAIAGVPAGFQLEHLQEQVDTDRMLDVSVSVKTISHVRTDQFGDSVWESTTGSGFLVSTTDCEVWTNHHVIADAAIIEVFPRRSSRTGGIPAKVVNSTPRSDIAILRMESCAGIPQASLGNSAAVSPGDEVYAVGNPLGRNPDSISRGIISHTQRYQSGSTPYLQTDAAVNPGSSGGALFDHDGQVIGINTGIAATGSGTNIGIGYAVPINLAKQVVSGLRQGPPSWGDAGLDGMVSTLTPEEAEIFRVPSGHAAIIITQAPSEGPAAGLLSDHDVVFKVDDTSVIDAEQAMRLLSAYNPGESVTLHLMRDGEYRSVRLTLEDGWSASEQHTPEYFQGYLGMTLEMWTGQEGEGGRFESPVITKVHSLGPAHLSHIASSQKVFAYRGPFMVAYLLDVKTVTGVVLEGRYHQVKNIDALERLTEQALRAGQPMLLEIEYWARPDPTNADAPLEKADTAYFRIAPSLTTAAAPGATPGGVQQASGKVATLARNLHPIVHP